MDKVTIFKLTTGQTLICMKEEKKREDVYLVNNPFVLVGMPTGELLLVPWVEGLKPNVSVELPESFTVTEISPRDMDTNLINTYISKVSNIVVPTGPRLVK